MNLVHLGAVRELMLAEFENDIASGRLFRSERLTDSGWKQYADLMRRAIKTEGLYWLIDQLSQRGMIQLREQRHTRRGIIIVDVPRTAAQTLGEGEYNRFYIRAVCIAVIAGNSDHVIAYRAKQVSNPRPESQAKINRRFPASLVLDSLRRGDSVENAIGIPAGANSGISVRAPDRFVFN